MKSRFTDKLILLLVIFVVFIGIFSFYQSNPKYLTGDDAAIHLSKAVFNVNKASVNYINPFKPFSEEPAYGNLYIDEFPFHVLVSGIMLSTGTDVISATKVVIFVLQIFLFIGLFLFLECIFRDRMFSFLAAFFAMFSYWIAIMYFEGTYAQIMGMVFIPFYLLLVNDYFNKKNNPSLIGAIAINGLLFFVHPLTFIFVCVLSFSYLLYFLVLNKKYIVLALLIIATVVILIVIALFPNLPYPKFYSGNITDNPSFELKDFYGKLISGLSPYIILGLFVAGIVSSLKSKKIVLIALLISYLFISSETFGVPFFPHRFNPYFMVLVIITVFYGFKELFIRIKNYRLAYLLLVLFFIVISVGVVYSFQAVKEAHVHFSKGLSPAIITDNDYAALSWIKENIPGDETILATNKWGYFVPSLAEHTVLLGDSFELHDVEKKDLKNRQEIAQQNGHAVFRETDSRVKAELLQSIGVKYIFVPDQMRKYISDYAPYEIYNTDFDSKYFSVFYKRGDAIVYKLR
ncbi:hypothetical protein KKH43_02465 [Patescibacteria group bacterium]|nr:hypothetical protein [Patescibacteria group bacterium]